MESEEPVFEKFSLLQRFTNQHRFYDKLFIYYIYYIFYTYYIYYIFSERKNRLKVVTNVQGGIDDLK